MLIAGTAARSVSLSSQFWISPSALCFGVVFDPTIGADG
jgi:hypothetical protein